MPPTTRFDLNYEPRKWRCEECGTILGVVMRDVKRIRRLWVFRLDRIDETMPSLEDLRTAPRGLYRVHGANDCQGVECCRCGAINGWNVIQESYDALMVRYPRKPL